MDSTLSMVMDKGADVIKAITGLYTAMYSFKDERIKAAVIEYRRAAEAMGAAVDKAEENYKDLVARGNDAMGGDAMAFIDGLLTEDERQESDLQAELIGAFIAARHENGLSQKRLGELSGVKQPIIARMEKGITSPQISTLMKVLAPLGKKLAIVPM